MHKCGLLLAAAPNKGQGSRVAIQRLRCPPAAAGLPVSASLLANHMARGAPSCTSWLLVALATQALLAQRCIAEVQSRWTTSKYKALSLHGS